MTNDPEEVAVYQAAMKALTDDVALSVEDSVKLLDELVS